MAILILDKSYVSNGPDTLTYTVTTAQMYNLKCQILAPSALGAGDGAGSGSGLGAGPGGGGEGFTGGDLGLGHGGVGQGFGPTNGYAQNASYGSNQTSFPNVTSGVVVTVKQNGSTIFTSPTLSPTQAGESFAFAFQGAVSDAIEVDITSAAAVDNQLNSLKVITTLGEGLF